MESNKQSRKKLDFVLPYVDDYGVAGEKTIHIQFTSLKMIEMYNALMHKVADIISIYQQMRETQESIGSSLIDSSDYSYAEDGSVDVKKIPLKERRDRYRKLQNKYKEYTDKLNAYSNNDFNQKWELIELILRKNGVSDPELLDKEWWMNCVDMHYVMAFIEASCTKDDTLVDVKKKQWM